MPREAILEVTRLRPRRWKAIIPTRVDPDSRVEFPMVEKSDSMS